MFRSITKQKYCKESNSVQRQLLTLRRRIRGRKIIYTIYSFLMSEYNIELTIVRGSGTMDMKNNKSNKCLG